MIFIRQNIQAPGRLSALPEGFKTYAAGTPEVWKMSLDPEAHSFDVGPYRQHVERHLAQRLEKRDA